MPLTYEEAGAAVMRCSERVRVAQTVDDVREALLVLEQELNGLCLPGLADEFFNLLLDLTTAEARAARRRTH